MAAGARGLLAVHVRLTFVLRGDLDLVMSEPDGDAPPRGEQLHIPKPSLQPVLVTVA